MPLSAPRLPGLRFETARPPAVPGLPRMDVAAFVGFASAGPVGVPVAVDDEVRFREVFGPDLPLAWDPRRGETVHAHLAPAVREFFRNGGRRCWIVRAGDEASLEAAAFRIPGMLHGLGRTLRAAFLLASSPGSWADGMSLNATLQATVLPRVRADERGIRLPVESPDLLKLEWPESGAVAFFPPHPGAPERDRAVETGSAETARPFAHAYWFTRVTWKEMQPVGEQAAFLAGTREVPLQPVGWQATEEGTELRLEIHLAAEAAPALQAGCWIRVLLPNPHPVDADRGGILGQMSDAEPQATDLPVSPAPPSPEIPQLWMPGGAPDPEAALPGAPEPPVEPPSEPPVELLPGEEPGSAPSEPPLLGRRVYLLVDEVRRDATGTVVTVRQGWRTMHHHRAREVVSIDDAQASLVSVELWTRRGDGSVVRMPDAGLVPRHPRFLGSLPPDQVLFAPTEQLVQSPTSTTAAQPFANRLRLAAPDARAYAVRGSGAVQLRTRDDDASEDGSGFAAGLIGAPGLFSGGADDDEGDGSGGFQAFLPLGVPTVLREDFFQAAHTSGRSPLERDGLGAYTPRLFLDEALESESAETLLDVAFHNAYVAELPRPPIRMHALLPVEEVSLLALPDAVHPGWELRTVDAPPPAPEAPYLVPMGQPDADGRIHVQWGLVGGALEYELQDSPDPRFRAGVEVTRIPVPADAHPSHVTVIRPRPCPDRLYFRIRVRTDAGFSPWSSTLLLDLPGDAFQGCGRTPLHAPVVTSFIPVGERLVVFWAPAAEDDALRAARAGYDRLYRVEMSPEPTFSLVELLYEGSDTQAETWKPLSGALFFRVASWLREKADADDGAPPRIVEESPWSTTLGFGTGTTRRWEVLAPAESDGAVTRALHVAMLRFCAARSDCFAVLALPRHHREPEALAHVGWLTSTLGGIAEPGDVGARTLSFGALYHPWTVVRTSSAAAPLRALPPDGATTGVMAARTNELGAWAAPANRPLAGVAVLDPKLPESVRATFLDRRVNAVAPFPRGFMTWSEETLSPDPELRGIGVRRLLILLRRLALREGNTWVFAPNDGAFRRLVQRQFDALLGDLYVRGAFAGATHGEGYRVVTDDTVNPRESVDGGRLVVELRVAPSRPLAFLTVRLVQAGAGITVQEA